MTIQSCSDVFAATIIPGSIRSNAGRSGGAYLDARAAVMIGDRDPVLATILVRDQPRRRIGRALRKDATVAVVAQWIDRFLLVRGLATEEQIAGEAAFAGMDAQARHVHRRRLQMSIERTEQDWRIADQADAAAALAA